MILAAVAALSAPAAAVEVSVADSGHAFNPQWSPDGGWLAFELNRYEGSIDLYVVKVQNGNPIGAPQQVTVPGASSSFSSSGSIAAAPTWHPKGMLIFEGSNAGGTNRLYFWVPGGQQASELLNQQQVKGDLAWPAVDPAGKTVAFVSDATGNGDLYYWDRSTNAVKQAISSPFSEAGPAYSGDGASISYSRQNRGGHDLFTWSGGTSTPRVGGNGDQSRPIWSATKLLFFSNERGEDHWDIAVSSGVGDKKTLAKEVRLPMRASPALSPDGAWVAYGLNDPDKANKIIVKKLDGSKTVEIDTGMVAAGEPSIIEAGGKVYLACTGLPSNEADWRKLEIIDITGKL